MAEIVLTDGGMGQEVIARSAAPPTNLWSGRVLAEEPHVVEAAHRDFIEAGARAIIVCSYSVTPERLSRDPAMADRFEELQNAALDIAAAVQATAPHDVAVLGCLPPLVGSYHPEKAPPREAMREHYARIVALQAPRVDVLLAETMSAVFEIEITTEAMRAADKPFWVAISVDDRDGTTMRSGEPLADGVAAARQGGAGAILLNCSRPEACTDGLPIVAEAGLPFGAYANGFAHAAELEPGQTVADMAVRDDLGPDAYAAHVMEWVERGATIVGGCCEVGPAHVAEIEKRLRAAGHEVVAP